MLGAEALIVTHDVAGLSPNKATRVVQGQTTHAACCMTATVDVVQGPASEQLLGKPGGELGDTHTNLSKDADMKPEELALIDKQLELMLTIQFRGMNEGERRYLTNSMATIRYQYEEAGKKRDAADVDEKTRKYYAGICESIAKGLPSITKGALSAATAFQKGDYLNGCAAIMDICAAAAPIIGGLAAAGGPPGALVGALFSVVGQLLTFFGPKQPSLQSQIKDMMLGLEAEEMLRTMSSVGDSIDVYAAQLISASQELPAILALPLQTEDDADDFQIKCRGLEIGIALGQTYMATPAFNDWQVLNWLRTKDRQDLDKWPEVLSVFCQAYMRFVNANVTFSCWPDRNVVYARLKETQDGNTTSPLPPHTRQNVHQVLINLEGAARAYREHWKNFNAKVLASMADIEQAARFRGLFFHVGDGFLYAGSGQRDIVGSNSWHYLSANPDRNGSGFGYVGKMTTTQTWGDMGSAKSPYHCFLLRPATPLWIDGIEYRTIRASNPPTSYPPTTGTFQERGGQPLRSIPGLSPLSAVSDLCAVPGGWPDKPNEVWLYVATGTKIVELELNEHSVLENRGWQSRAARSQVVSVRAVYPDSVRDDPDGDIESVFSSVDPQVNTLTHYGGLANSPDIFVIKHDGYIHEYVPTPWSQYAGIGVDEHYLWVFGTGGFACATHASVLKAVNERAKGHTSSKPRWMVHYPNRLLYKGLSTRDELVGPRPGEPVLRGLHDLAPCEDGTLTASVVTRSYDKNGRLEGEAGPDMYTAGHQVDIKAGTLRVGGWTKFAGGPPQQVQKQPIYCWPMFESLKARLVAEGQQV